MQSKLQNMRWTMNGRSEQELNQVVEKVIAGLDFIDGFFHRVEEDKKPTNPPTYLKDDLLLIFQQLEKQKELNRQLNKPGVQQDLKIVHETIIKQINKWLVSFKNHETNFLQLLICFPPEYQNPFLFHLRTAIASNELSLGNDPDGKPVKLDSVPLQTDYDAYARLNEIHRNWYTRAFLVLLGQQPDATSRRALLYSYSIEVLQQVFSATELKAHLQNSKLPVKTVREIAVDIYTRISQDLVCEFSNPRAIDRWCFCQSQLKKISQIKNVEDAVTCFEAISVITKIPRFQGKETPADTFHYYGEPENANTFANLADLLKDLDSANKLLVLKRFNKLDPLYFAHLIQGVTLDMSLERKQDGTDPQKKLQALLDLFKTENEKRECLALCLASMGREKEVVHFDNDHLSKLIPDFFHLSMLLDALPNNDALLYNMERVNLLSFLGEDFILTIAQGLNFEQFSPFYKLLKEAFGNSPDFLQRVVGQFAVDFLAADGNQTKPTLARLSKHKKDPYYPDVLAAVSTLTTGTEQAKARLTVLQTRKSTAAASSNLAGNPTSQPDAKTEEKTAEDDAKPTSPLDPILQKLAEERALNFDLKLEQQDKIKKIQAIHDDIIEKINLIIKKMKSVEDFQFNLLILLKNVPIEYQYQFMSHFIEARMFLPIPTNAEDLTLYTRELFALLEIQADTDARRKILAGFSRESLEAIFSQESLPACLPGSVISWDALYDVYKSLAEQLGNDQLQDFPKKSAIERWCFYQYCLKSQPDLMREADADKAFKALLPSHDRKEDQLVSQKFRQEFANTVEGLKNTLNNLDTHNQFVLLQYFSEQDPFYVANLFHAAKPTDQTERKMPNGTEQKADFSDKPAERQKDLTSVLEIFKTDQTKAGFLIYWLESQSEVIGAEMAKMAPVQKSRSSTVLDKKGNDTPELELSLWQFRENINACTQLANELRQKSPNALNNAIAAFPELSRRTVPTTFQSMEQTIIQKIEKEGLDGLFAVLRNPYPKNKIDILKKIDPTKMRQIVTNYEDFSKLLEMIASKKDKNQRIGFLQLLGQDHIKCLFETCKSSTYYEFAYFTALLQEAFPSERTLHYATATKLTSNYLDANPNLQSVSEELRRLSTTEMSFDVQTGKSTPHPAYTRFLSRLASRGVNPPTLNANGVDETPKLADAEADQVISALDKNGLR